MVDVSVETATVTERDWPGERRTLVSLSATVGPVGVMVDVSVTFPLKPILSNVTVALVDRPASNLDGDATPAVRV